MACGSGINIEDIEKRATSTMIKFFKFDQDERHAYVKLLINT